MIHNPDNRSCDSDWEGKEVTFKRSDLAVLSNIQIWAFQGNHGPKSAKNP
jgi:hypothetical protein